MHPRRERLLEILRSSPQPQDIAALAAELDVHPNTVRFHLDSLLASGLVERAEGAPTSRGRPPLLFRATRRMDAAGPQNYRFLATMFTDHLSHRPDPTGEAIALGRRWGRRLTVRPTRPGRAGAIRALVATLDDLGFAPEPPRRTAVHLRHCPFLDLVTTHEHGAVVCSLHLGVMQGALDAIDSPVTVDRLTPFAEPDRCTAHLAPAGA